MSPSYIRMAAIVLLAGCSDPWRPVESSEDSSSNGMNAAADVDPYPPGRWRLVDPSSLDHVVLWVSHILIRHEGSDTTVPGTVHDWVLDSAPRRSRAEALGITAAIAAEAKRDPARFAQLATEHSEDSTTAANGGSLGGVKVFDFIRDPPLLDALAAIEPGEVSRVVETRHGFHVLLRRGLPADAEVSGAHIVIGHVQTAWLSSIGHPGPKRTRQEAIRFAERIYADAVNRPDDFRTLVRQFSEHPDKAMDGDIGTWSVREPTYLPRAIERLQALRPGEVARPFESHLGLEILQRTPDRQRNVYAMEAIKIAFEPADEPSKQWAMTRAAEVFHKLETQPQLFDTLRATYCCPSTESWSEGREEPGLSSAVARLAIGELGQPIEQYADFTIPRRVAAPASARAAADFEMPAAEAPDLNALLSRLSRRAVVYHLTSVAAEQGANLQLNAEQRHILRELQREVEGGPSCGGDKLTRRDFFSIVDALLRDEHSPEYRTLVAQRLEAEVLRASNNPL